MKTLYIPGGVLVLAGIVLLFLPIHMQMTGLILILVGGALALFGLLYPKAGRKLRTFLWVLLILASSGVVMLMACMNLISDFGQTNWNEAREADWAIVLGAGVNPDGAPSRIMRQRLGAAMEFMAENPHATVILSGAQGNEEPRSEAQVMYDTLVDMGADPARLMLEEESMTTLENLKNSMAIIGPDALRGPSQKPVAVITSEFHQRRTAYIAKKLGLEMTPVSAHTDQWFYRVNYTLREVFSMVKAWFTTSKEPGLPMD